MFGAREGVPWVLSPCGCASWGGEHWWYKRFSLTASYLAGGKDNRADLRLNYDVVAGKRFRLTTGAGPAAWRGNGGPLLAVGATYRIGSRWELGAECAGLAPNKAPRPAAAWVFTSARLW